MLAASRENSWGHHVGVGIYRGQDRLALVFGSSEKEKKKWYKKRVMPLVLPWIDIMKENYPLRFDKWTYWS